LEKITLFWVLSPCRFIGRYQRFGETYCFHFQGHNFQVVPQSSTPLYDFLSYLIKCILVKRLVDYSSSIVFKERSTDLLHNVQWKNSGVQRPYVSYNSCKSGIRSTCSEFLTPTLQGWRGAGGKGWDYKRRDFFLKSYYSCPNTREFGFSSRAILFLCASTRHPPPHLHNLLTVRSIRSTGVQIHRGNADACFPPTDTTTTITPSPATHPLRFIIYGRIWDYASYKKQLSHISHLLHG
jgi:hypothetical protein